MAGSNSHFTRWSISVFNNYVVPDKIIIRSNLGVSELTSDAPGATGSGRPLLTSNSDLLYFLGPAILGLKIERGFSETFGLGQNFGVVETSGYSGSVVYRFTPLLSVTGIGSYRENNFRGESGGVAGRDDKIVSGSARLTYQILRWLAATLEYTYTDAKSSDSTASYVENRARIALNALFY